MQKCNNIIDNTIQCTISQGAGRQTDCKCNAVQFSEPEAFTGEWGWCSGDNISVGVQHPDDLEEETVDLALDAVVLSA